MVMKDLLKNPKQTFVIAEIGVNHNNDISMAKKLIEKAKFAGADAVKFQTFKAKNLVLPGTRKVKNISLNHQAIKKIIIK